jgi:hypothetical protein
MHSLTAEHQQQQPTEQEQTRRWQEEDIIYKKERRHRGFPHEQHYQYYKLSFKVRLE